MSQIHQKIKYLRECYSSDSSGIEVQNVFSRSIEHRMFIEGENDLAFEGNHKIPLNLKIRLEARDASIKYEREKELVYSTMFIVGKNSELSQKWASPLLLFPSKIVPSARANIALLSLMICLYEFFQVLLEDFLLE